MDTSSIHPVPTDARREADAEVRDFESVHWMKPTLAVTTALFALTLAPGISAASSALVKPNEIQELGYPLLGAPIGMIMVLLATRIAPRRKIRWAGLLAGAGVAWTFNALLVALRGWGVDGHLPHTVFVAATWVAQWSYIPADIATFVVLPMALPFGRIVGWWRWGVGAVLASAMVQAVCGALGAGVMDDTVLENPFGLGSGHGLIALRDNLYLPTLLAGVVLVFFRAFTVRRDQGVRYARVLCLSVGSLLIATIAEGSLQEMDVACWAPWLPVTAAVLGSTVGWSRVAVQSAGAR